MNFLLIVYITISWILLSGLMWADWYNDRKPNSVNAMLIAFVYIIFMPVLWLSRIGRE